MNRPSAVLGSVHCLIHSICAELPRIQRDVYKRQHFSLGIHESAKRFYLYGIMAEIFGRKNGFAEGLGNSMHAFFIPFGVYPNNAIVGGSAPIATGAALYKKNMKKKGIVVANAGDGSLGCGPVWESMNFASMDQYHTLWEEGYKLSLIHI